MVEKSHHSIHRPSVWDIWAAADSAVYNGATILGYLVGRIHNWCLGHDDLLVKSSNLSSCISRNGEIQRMIES
jgi:hypothetical protein